MSIPRVVKEVLKSGIQNYDYCISAIKGNLLTKESWFDNPDNEFGKKDKKDLTARIAEYEETILVIQKYIEENQ